jgi:uncharacterized RDD family membrane protein YckC
MKTTTRLLGLLLLASGLAAAPLLSAQEPPAVPAAPAAAEAPAPAPAPKSLKQKLHDEIHDAVHDKVKAATKVADGVDGDIKIGKHAVTITATGISVTDGEGHPGADEARGRHDNALVTIGHDATLEAGAESDAVVAVLGNATSAGKVVDAVVSVLGDTHVTGPVGNSVVSVLGNTYVDSEISENVVSVLGDVELGPHAVVNGEVATIGGTLVRDPAAKVNGSVQTVTMFHHGGGLDGFHAWVRHALLYGRPLAIAPGLGWAWTIAAIFMVLYLLIAMLFPRGIERSVRTMEEAPGSSVLAAFLTLLLKPVVFMLVFITVIGIMLVPFMVVALWVIGLFGKAVAFAWLGRRLLPKRESPETWFTVLTVLIGGLLATVLYLVPVLGFIVYKGLDILGVGIVVYTLLQVMRANRAAANPPPAATIPPTESAASEAPAGVADAAGAASASAAPAPRPAPVAATSYPRAGFWIRMAALWLDIIIVAIACNFLHLHDGLFMIAVAAYGAVMWKLRGTTVGGIVCNLRIVRQDGRELDWATAIVRGLACFLSTIALGLGFLWIAFDGERQGWHDKIAGTVVVRVPKAASLV